MIVESHSSTFILLRVPACEFSSSASCMRTTCRDVRNVPRVLSAPKAVTASGSASIRLQDSRKTLRLCVLSVSLEKKKREVFINTHRDVAAPVPSRRLRFDFPH